MQLQLSYGYISEHGKSGNLMKKSRIAVYSLKRKLAALVIVSVMGVGLSAGGIHYFEKEAQPDAFGTLSNSMQWTIITFTTIGYGDISPITTGGKVVAVLVSLMGFGLIIGVVGIALHAYFRRALESIMKKSRIAVYSLKRKLAALVIVSVMGVGLSAGGIHYFEKEAQPDAFGTLSNSMQWTIITFTTIGYGDISPITTGGKVVAVLVSLMGFGLPIGVVGIALHAYFRRALESMKHEVR